MTHIRLKYVQAFVDRKTGAVFRYFRRPGFPRVRLPGLPGSPEFNRAYEDALAGAAFDIGTGRTRPGSINAVVVAYYRSLEWGAVSAGTRSQRRSILERFRAAHGDKPVALLPQKFIVAMLADLKPFAARSWLKCLRALLQFAVMRGFRPDDPTQGIKLPRAKTDGIYTWSEDDIAAFETTHPVGSKPRLALALLLYTAQRRADVIRMGPQHIRAGVLTVRQQKTGATLAIPVHSDLWAILDATPGSHLTFLTTSLGAYTANNFTEQFRKWCDAAGLSKQCSPHGLRKAACRRLAEAGCSANEIASISGHASLREIERYTRAVDQAHMARNAMARRRERPGNKRLSKTESI